jgi:hypothetical protein
MLCNGGQQFAVRSGRDRRPAPSQPAPAQPALDRVGALTPRVNGGFEPKLHGVSLPAQSLDSGRRRATGLDTGAYVRNQLLAIDN